MTAWWRDTRFTAAAAYLLIVGVVLLSTEWLVGGVVGQWWVYVVAIAGLAAAVLLVDPAVQGPAQASLPPALGTALASVAVFPLNDLSVEDEDPNLAEAMSWEIIRALSGVPDMRVVNYLHSMIVTKFRNLPLDKIVEELDVRYILSGSVQRSDGRVRIIATFTDAVDGTQLWSDAFDEDADDLFEVQRRIAHAIAVSCGSEYINAVAQNTAREEPGNLDAWSLTHRAFNFWIFRYSKDASDEAVTMLRRAIRMEPDYGVAHATLAFLLSQRAINGWSRNPEKEIAEALSNVDRAIELTPRDATVMEQAGLVWFNLGMQDRAEPILRDAVQVSPYNLVAWGYLGVCLTWNGMGADLDEGNAILDRILEEAPRHPSVPYWNFFKAGACARLGEFEKAREFAETATRLQPGFAAGWAALANALGRLGRADEAAAAMEAAREFSPTFDADYISRYYHGRFATEEIYDAHTLGLRMAGLVSSD